MVVVITDAHLALFIWTNYSAFDVMKARNLMSLLVYLCVVYL